MTTGRSHLQLVLIALLITVGCGGVEEDVDFDASAVTKKTIALRTFNGHYVVAEFGGGAKLNADRTAVGPWERFALVSNGGGTVGLRASTGHWVTAEGGGGGRVVADRVAQGPWETFTLVRFDDGRYAFRTYHGWYLVAEYGGGATFLANRRAIGEWEKFRIEHH